MTSTQSIHDAQMGMVEAYISKIREYAGKDEEKSRQVTKKLERLVDSLVPIELGQFDPDLARKTRDSLRITRDELSEIVDIHPITIYKYEKGKLKLEKNNRRSSKYIGWLKEHGYNPFNF